MTAQAQTSLHKLPSLPIGRGREDECSQFVQFVQFVRIFVREFVQAPARKA